MRLEILKNRLIDETYADEHGSMVKLTFNTVLDKRQRQRVLENAKSLVALCRKDKHGKGTLDSFLEEFGLSNKEGVALMCLAEALLRVPDARTADRLISEKILAGNWGAHQGKSDSVFVNASTWGLMLTGTVVELPKEYRETPGSSIKRLVSKLGEPVVRAAVLQAMRIMGGQYVLGRSIDEAVTRGKKQNSGDTRFSFDMLGEAARTDSDAIRYFEAYASAIDRIGSTLPSSDPITGDGISVKLSALHPRYHYSHQDTVLRELLPRIKALCLLAKQHCIGLSLDAEECERLEISLDLFEVLARDEELACWQGLGLVLQTYQKRAPHVVNWLIELARETKRRIPVRLVKGAYWDAEIKRAQELGLREYPVFTRKANTDACYLHCAEKVLREPELIYPQFATHNAYTATMVLELAGETQFEFQRLHGMGQILYQQLAKQYPKQTIPVRVYAPVGSHEDLLPYLVRRLLENGANSSFVNRFLDSDVPIDELVEDVYRQVHEVFPHEHSAIARPPEIFKSEQDDRKNSLGIDVELSVEASNLLRSAGRASTLSTKAGAIVNGETIIEESERVVCPADSNHTVGWISESSPDTVLMALSSADLAHPPWNAMGPQHRAEILRRVAILMEGAFSGLVGLLSYEAGRTINDCISEVREAIDFCRYYANQAEKIMLDGSGLEGRGTFLCISPWNFPLAIFAGQVAAALAAGNSVLAKPAEQTPLIAFRAVQLFHQAGVPTGVLHLLPGDGARIGSVLTSDARITGVAFTGSTDTAKHIFEQICHRGGRGIPLIAETGGQNCLIADSTALPEQLVDDVMESAFSSAGQRCSALRVLFVQTDIAAKVIEMLQGALRAKEVGKPWCLSTDVGPVIDAAAQKMLRSHINRMNEQATLLGTKELDVSHAEGTYVSPHIFEIEKLEQLEREVFGPVLHVIRYKAEEIDSVIDSINKTGFGLTLGVHSRIESFAKYIFRNTNAGNTYINRNMVGAVVGVNPFGGTGLSGTGPKAGGPNYLYRFCQTLMTGSDSMGDGHVEIPVTNQERESVRQQLKAARTAQVSWSACQATERARILRECAGLFATGTAEYFELFADLTRNPMSRRVVLPGPTGEENILTITGKGVVACVITPGDTINSIAIQAGAVLAAGCSVILVGGPICKELTKTLSEAFSHSSVQQPVVSSVSIDDAAHVLKDSAICAVSVSGHLTDHSQISAFLSTREGPLTPLVELPVSLSPTYPAAWYGILTSFICERTFTDNLVAKGGNTQLFNLEENIMNTA